MVNYRRVIFWRLDLDRPGASAPDARFELAGAHQVDELATAIHLRPQDVRDRMAWARCYVGRVDGTIATFGWVSSDETRLGELHSTVTPDAGEAYVWHCETLTSFRGRGLYTTMLRHMASALTTSGIRVAWIATLAGNRAAARSVERAGYHPVLDIRYLRAGPWSTWIVRPRVASPEEIAAATRALRLGHLPRVGALVAARFR